MEIAIGLDEALQARLLGRSTLDGEGQPLWQAWTAAHGGKEPAAYRHLLFAGRLVAVKSPGFALDVAAGVKQQLEMDAQRVGGVRLLPGRFMVIEQSMGVPKGRTAAQAWLSSYIEEMKATGFVAAALKRHNIQGAAVAPAR